MTENTEIMEVTPYEEENEEIVDENCGSKMGTGLAMIIGSGLTIAAIAGGKKLKKLWASHKAKKEQQEVTIIEDAESDETDETVDEVEPTEKKKK